MNTQFPLSTISWNSEGFLRSKLNDLLGNVISFWGYIEHIGEDDEAGKKNHFHVFLEPCKRLQTIALRSEFMELDINRPDKPILPLDFHKSKFGDWWWYNQHDSNYLACKCEMRKYHYDPSAFVWSDDAEANFRIKQADISEVMPIRKLVKGVEAGMSFGDMCVNGWFPVQQIRCYAEAYRYVVAHLPSKSSDSASVRCLSAPDAESEDLPFDGEIMPYPLAPLGNKICR